MSDDYGFYMSDERALELIMDVDRPVIMADDEVFKLTGLNPGIMKGDLLELAKQGRFHVIVHGCNCFHTMGAGIAWQIAQQFPQAVKADFGTPYANKEKLGTFSETSAVGNDDSIEFVIVNGYTQYSTGGFAVSYDAIDKLFKKIAREFPKDTKIGYPMIGAGLAGGDWDVIKVIIEKALDGFNHTLVEYEP